MRNQSPSCLESRGVQNEVPSFQAARNSQYIYVEYDAGDRELYDLVNDPYQLTNVADNPSYASVKTTMQNLLNTLRGGSSSSITVITPNGGENWQIGTTQTIQWTSSNVSGNVNIELSRNGGVSYQTLFANIGNDGSEPRGVSGATTTQALIRISSTDNPSVSDVSNGVFTVSASVPSITVISPNGGESWRIGTIQTIRWTSVNIWGNVKILRLPRRRKKLFCDFQQRAE